jgi:hypothetical protein
MAGPRYPLETLRKLRDDRAEAQTHALAAQIARSQAAAAQLRSREAARREHVERLTETRRAEQTRLAAGVSGAELLRLADFEVAARVRGEALAQAELEAQKVLEAERAKERNLRQELASREAEAELVRRHEAGFHGHHAELREKAEEEAALEQWSAKRT